MLWATARPDTAISSLSYKIAVGRSLLKQLAGNGRAALLARLGQVGLNTRDESLGAAAITPVDT
jgi:hypothetical protein